MEPITAIVSTIVTGIATGFVEKGGADLMTAIREKLTQARRQGILEDLQQEQTEENKSEFQLALKTQMDKDKDFENKVRELVEQIELERQKNSPTQGEDIKGASIENVETETGDISPVDIGNTQGNAVTGADIKDVKTKTGTGSAVKIGNTTQTN